MENTSPLKSWIHRHSPMKSRNKPLPPSPPDSNSVRKPVEPVSGNTSPSKPKSFLARFKPKSHAIPPTPPPSCPQNQRTPIHKKAFRSGRGRTPDLRTVSKKISDLEAQLKEAQRELQTIAAQQQPQPSLDEVVDVDWEINQRQASLTRDGRFDGLTENLLLQINPNLRPVTRRGPPEASTNAYLEYQAAEAAYEPVAADVETPQSTRLKRKRSEASWQEMQDRIAEFQKQQQPPEMKKMKCTLDAPQCSQPATQTTKIFESVEVDLEFRELDDIISLDEAEEVDEELTALPQIRPRSHHACLSSPPSSPTTTSRRCQSLPAQSTATITTRISPSNHQETKQEQEKPETFLLKLTTPQPLHKNSSSNRNSSTTNDDNDAAGSSTSTTTISAAQRAAHRRAHIFVPWPHRLSKVIEEFEWNDEEIF